MSSKTYYVGKNSVIRKRVDVSSTPGTTPWAGWANVASSSFFGTAAELYDVMTVPGNPDTVFVVGALAQNVPFKGIAYSPDAGQNWYAPGILNVVPNFPRVFYEVWILNSNTVYVAGEKGWVLKGTYTGLNYEFDFNSISQINSGAQDCYSVYFQDANMGIVGLENTIALTNDGGATWSLIPVSGATAIKGVYRDGNQIVAVCDNKIIYTNNYISGFQELLWSSFGADDIIGNHLTWYKPNSSAVPVFWATTNKNIIVTATGTAGPWLIWNNHFYNNIGGKNYLAAHFFKLNEGFLGLTNGFTGSTKLDYYIQPTEISNVDFDVNCKSLEAVWTEIDQRFCYLIRNCKTNQEYVTSTDLSAYVNKVLFNLSINQQRPSEDCYLVVGTTACIQNTVTVTVPTTVIEYNSCSDCLERCYKLISCIDPSDFIIYTPLNDYDPFEDYLYQVVQIPELCGDKCYFVDKTVCPDIPVPIPNPIELVPYATCNACLGKAPVELLHTRAVKPGFYTPGCPPDYTVKTNCRYAEQLYDEMVAIRYGISICCDHDVDKWDIKKQLLELSAIYDPELCKVSCSNKCIEPCNVTATINTYTLVPYTPPSPSDCVIPTRPTVTFLPDPL